MISAQNIRRMQKETTGELQVCEERIISAAQASNKCFAVVVKLNCPERCIPMLEELGYTTRTHDGYLYIGWGKE